MSTPYEKEYNTEPQSITENVSIAPTMAGGIALLVNGEHVEHFYENELEELEEVFGATLNSIEHTGHSTASERKFERYMREFMRGYVELGFYMELIMTNSNDGYYDTKLVDNVAEACADLMDDADMLHMMAEQMEE